MTIRNVPETELKYHLISYDKRGEERTDDPDAPNGRASEAVLEALGTEPITDVFLISHGWKGDVPAAIRQYDAWIAAMARCEDDRRTMRRRRPGFRPLVVGLHWPSLPWGNEELPAGAVSFATPGEDPLTELVDEAADGIADSERARRALRTIFAAGLDDVAPRQMPPEVVAAYKVLWQETGLEASGPAGAPGEDAERFDPETSYRTALTEEDVSFGGGQPGPLLAPLRQLSFWKMKKRARRFGENGAASLLRELQRRSSELRCHLMGHSFGCIVVSATVAGAGGQEPLPRPVDSLFLVQGALSFWSYCSDVPAAEGKSGYFHSIPRDGKVAGPVVTTQSVHDTAVGTLYPKAAGLARQVSFAPGELPRYGALGTFGVRGPGVDLVDLPMLVAADAYPFEPGKVYNLESSQFICEGRGLSGAHSDVAKPEVAHAFWSAVMAEAA